ncbi:MAG: HD domain-containing protein [Blautia sp.]|nr:HD domain-containing protein [Blautia sp.]
MVELLEQRGRFAEEKEAIQHGTTTVHEHSIRVADMSQWLAEKLKLKVHQESLLRGALLHDYFLYDWHHQEECTEGLHGFSHPKTAEKNASKDFNLTDVERDIIRHHMFPLTLSPPKTKEGWVVCAADKICAVQETAGPMAKKAVDTGAQVSSSVLRRLRKGKGKEKQRKGFDK